MIDALYFDRDYKFVWKCLKAYMGTQRWIFFVLFAGSAAAAVLFAVSVRGKKENDITVKGIYGSAGILLTSAAVLNPYLILKLLDRVVEPATYYRFFWALPLTLMTAFYLTAAVKTAPGKFGKAAAVAAVCLVLFLNRDFSYVVQTNFHIPENIYKVPDGLIYACSVIHEDYGDGEDRLPKAVFSDRYELFARQYDPSVRLTIPRDIRLKYNGSQTLGEMPDNKTTLRKIQILDAINSQNDITVKQFHRAMNRTRTDYIVIPDYFTSHDFLLEAGCRKVAEGEGVVIYRYYWE